MNFVEQAENTLVGWRRNPDLKLAVVDEHGEDVSEGFISYTNGEIRLIRSVVPSMFTTFAPKVLDDCLGYLMQRYTLKITADRDWLEYSNPAECPDFATRPGAE